MENKQMIEQDIVKDLTNNIKKCNSQIILIKKDIKALENKLINFLDNEDYELLLKKTGKIKFLQLKKKYYQKMLLNHNLMERLKIIALYINQIEIAEKIDNNQVLLQKKFYDKKQPHLK